MWPPYHSYIPQFLHIQHSVLSFITLSAFPWELLHGWVCTWFKFYLNDLNYWLLYSLTHLWPFTFASSPTLCSTVNLNVPGQTSWGHPGALPFSFIAFPIAHQDLFNYTTLFCIFKILFIYFWLCWVLVAACWLSLVAASRGYSSLRCTGFSLRWLLLWSTGSRGVGFSSCGTRAQ